MSTNDVPGFDPKHADALAMGCWAEHDDGSLIFVESTEGNRVIYSIFDNAKNPVIEYRDSMPEVNFKRQFSFGPSGLSKEKWTWHDKTGFPWDRVIKVGHQDGLRYASAQGIKTAAERVGESLSLRARAYDDRHAILQDEELVRVGSIVSKLERAISNLPTAIAAAFAKTLPTPKGKTSKTKPKR